MIAVSLDCFVSLRTSSFRTNWYHLMPSSSHKCLVIQLAAANMFTKVQYTPWLIWLVTLLAYISEQTISYPSTDTNYCDSFHKAARLKRL